MKVRMIALAGVAAQTGVVMLVYLDHAYVSLKAKRQAEGKAVTPADLYAAVAAILAYLYRQRVESELRDRRAREARAPARTQPMAARPGSSAQPHAGGPR